MRTWLLVLTTTIPLEAWLVGGWVAFGGVVCWVERLSVDSWTAKRRYLGLSVALVLLLSLVGLKALAYHQELVWLLRQCH